MDGTQDVVLKSSFGERIQIILLRAANCELSCIASR
jgi:hypothetical protein